MRHGFQANSNRTKYCKYCRDKVQVQRNRAYKEKKESPNTEYLKEKYDYIRVNVPKGERDKIKAYAESQGMSVNKLLLTALEEYQNSHK